MNVLEFKREGWRDTVRALRKVADDLESGVLPACDIAALALRTRSGEVSAFAFGPMADDLQALALFRLGEQVLIEALLPPHED